MKHSYDQVPLLETPRPSVRDPQSSTIKLDQILIPMIEYFVKEAYDNQSMKLGEILKSKIKKLIGECGLANPDVTLRDKMCQVIANCIHEHFPEARSEKLSDNVSASTIGLIDDKIPNPLAPIKLITQPLFRKAVMMIDRGQVPDTSKPNKEMELDFKDSLRMRLQTLSETRSTGI